MTTLINSARIERLREQRLGAPAALAVAFRDRVRRPLLAGDGRLLLIAADHTARGALGVGADPMAMANRADLLDRLVRALERPGVDGVLGTPDIIEDLALLGHLDGRIVAGSLNRGGVQGARFEIDDRFTAYDVPALVRDRLDVAKALIRVNLDDPATARTLEQTAHAVSAAHAAGIPIMLEPFLSRWHEGRPTNQLTADATITAIAIAQGLGNSSAHTWLKLPVVPEMDRVIAATTLPVLLLGGDPGTAPERTHALWAEALAVPGVRGLVVGRALLYPPDGRVEAAVDSAAELVHGSLGPGAAASRKDRLCP